MTKMIILAHMMILITYKLKDKKKVFAIMQIKG